MHQSVNKARGFYLDIDFLNIALLQAYNFMTHLDRQHIFILLSCSEIKMFEEGILGGKLYRQHAKV